MIANSERAKGWRYCRWCWFSLWLFLQSAWALADLPPANPTHPSEKRLALVIGNAKYTVAPLSNPGNDAALMARTLRQLGFAVTELTELDADGMRAAIRAFADTLGQSPDAVGLFYFAGHGVQIKGENYLIPVGRKFIDEREVEDDAINVDYLLKRFAEARARVSFVILDACRNNPFAAASRNLRGAGLARMDAPSGMLIAYATAPGSVASDGSAGNGLYTAQLARAMKVPGLSAEQTFKRTREWVETESGGAQSPREESSLKGRDFHFLPLADGRLVNPELVELTYWESIRNSGDVADFDSYLRDHPQGKFAALARQAISRLKKQLKADPSFEKLGQAYAALARGEPHAAKDLFSALATSSSANDQARGREGLAELALREGNPDKAGQLAEEALRLRNHGTGALLVLAKVAFQRNARDDARRLAIRASADDAVSDFPWQKANALIAAGNLLRKDQPAKSVGSYQAALRLDPANLDAVSNLAVVAHENDDPRLAAQVIDRARRDPVANMDPVLSSLAYRLASETSARNDTERAREIDRRVKDLVGQMNISGRTREESQDTWTSAPLAISVLGFDDLGGSLAGRVGLDVLMAQEVDRELRARNLMVVDRALIDKLLAELNLGSSRLADPESQLRLGRLTAARLVAVGKIFQLGGREMVSFRVVDVETSRVVFSQTLETAVSIDPINTSAALARMTAEAIDAHYPIRGRIAQVEGNVIVVNLGRKHGILPGDVFNVLADGPSVESGGRLIGRADVPLGSLRIASVDEAMATAVPRQILGQWTLQSRIVHFRAGGN